MNAYKIFGPDLAGLRGKTVRRDMTRICPKYVEIMQEMVSLTTDIMFVNQIPFVITYGRGVGLRTVKWLPN